MRQTATQIVKRLQGAGYLAYFAGGCVRDRLLGIEPKDYDITTNAKPEEVAALFTKTLDVGRTFGVVVVVEDGIQFEVATFRAEHGYSDGRRPDEVSYSETPQEDVIRRDFTINGLLEDPVTGDVLDFVGGIKDLQARIVRAIGDPAKRFDEDHLRLMRAIRFAAKLGFDLDSKTLAEVTLNSWKLVKISRERIRDELVKILISPKAAWGMNKLCSTGLINNIIPELRTLIGLEQGRYHDKDAYEHTMDVLGQVSSKLEIRVAALLHDIGKPMTRAPHVRNEYCFYGHDEKGEELAIKILRRLKFTNKQVEHISRLVGLHMSLCGFRKGELADRSLRKFARKCGSPEMLGDALALMRADYIVHPNNSVDVFDTFTKRFENLKMSGEQMTAKQKVVSGKDVMEVLGLSQGPEVGRVLKRVQEMLDEDPNLTKEDLLQRIR